jgi:hypothetical protein
VLVVPCSNEHISRNSVVKGFSSRKLAPRLTFDLAVGALTFFTCLRVAAPIGGEGCYRLPDWDQSRRRPQRSVRTRGFGGRLTACAFGKSPKQTNKDVIRIAGMLVFISGKLRKNLADLSSKLLESECSREFARGTPAATVKRLRAVSSVAEHLVYAE